VDLPDKLEIIEQYAFYSCDELYKIYIPKNVESIGYSAFK
jgi:hypothetical protein